MAVEMVAGLGGIDPARVDLWGGKATQLAALVRLEGVAVPQGFAVGAGALQAALEASPPTLALLAAWQGAQGAEAKRPLAAALRGAIEALPLPAALVGAIAQQLEQAPANAAWAVRSSAVAEDAPTASHAGAFDSFLGVVGLEAVLWHLRRCWASLWGDRAIAYREAQGEAEAPPLMAVVVQRMVSAQASGLLFTADPLSGQRGVACIEACLGLGEALVSGLVRPEGHRVVGERVTTTRPGEAEGPVLSESQVLELAALGRRLEAHFGSPQDLEWCLDPEGAFQLVQSRPITTLYPLPSNPEGAPRVYLSVGHPQMMTDAFKALGSSHFQAMALRPMHEAGGRLFVDIARELANPAMRGAFLRVWNQGDPLVGDALRQLIARDVGPEGLPEEAPPESPPEPGPFLAPLPSDPAIVAGLVAREARELAASEAAAEGLHGEALFDFIAQDMAGLKAYLSDPQNAGAIQATMAATAWLNAALAAWLGEKNAADALAQGVAGNVTTEMGLALLDAADAIRPHPAVVAYLQTATDEGFLAGLAEVPGGQDAHAALSAFLDRFGVRCPGEIDLTRPRWVEQPTALVPLLLGHVAALAPGAAARQVAAGQAASAQAEARMLVALRALPEGEAKAQAFAEALACLRCFAGFREFPKFAMVRRFFVHKRALLREAQRLVQAGALARPEEAFHLRLDEFREAARTQSVPAGLVAQRAAAHAWHQQLAPPRVMTGEGERIAGTYRRGPVPEGALVGLAVSAGVVEGRARVVRSLAEARLAPGDVLVTRFTDPSWTPAFLGIAGLVAEVGGLMTHGSVVAREYGLPAVVGVEGATARIRDGQRIRVNGTEGLVELLDGGFGVNAAQRSGEG